MTDPDDLIPDASVDLGELGCGDLVMELLKAIQLLKPGQILKVHALDPAAPIDITAWCFMRKHELLAARVGEDKTYFYIRKGENSHG